MFITHTFTSFIIAAILSPTFLSPFADAQTSPIEQDFVITAYYSPLSDQCCYVTGSYEGDIELNGRGTNGADGTAVYPGMAAAPKSYAFGTRIALPGIGTVTVHDRGGAIIEQGEKHRLDLWVGHGEEGLARALAFGVGRVRGTIYPNGSAQPGENMNLKAMPAPVAKLEPFISDQVDMTLLQAKEGDYSLSVEILQQRLHDLGYFERRPTGTFGAETKQSLEAFYRDYGIEHAPAAITKETSALIVAAVERLKARDPLEAFIEPGVSSKSVLAAKKALRFLGYYRGRTNDQYDDTLKNAIMAFQKDHALIADATSLGAGRIGPKTKAALILAWRKEHVLKRAEKILVLARIDELIAKRGEKINGFLSIGDRGKKVAALQSLLAKIGSFPTSRISGLFGPVTKEAVMAYQLQKGVIKDAKDPGAGTVGPATLVRLRREQRQALYRIVRSEGWAAL